MVTDRFQDARFRCSNAQMVSEPYLFFDSNGVLNRVGGLRSRGVPDGMSKRRKADQQQGRMRSPSSASCEAAEP